MDILDIMLGAKKAGENDGVAGVGFPIITIDLTLYPDEETITLNRNISAQFEAAYNMRTPVVINIVVEEVVDYKFVAGYLMNNGALAYCAEMLVANGGNQHFVYVTAMRNADNSGIWTLTSVL